MDAEAVRTIASLGRDANTTPDLTNVIKLENGQSFTYRNDPTENGRELGDILVPPQPAPLVVTTLTGFADAIQTGISTPAEFLIHVENYLTVSLKERSVDQWGRRSTHITAKFQPLNAFTFDHYYSDLPKFIIALQVSFLTTDELLYVIRLASNLKAGNTVQAEDDGFSQSVTIRTGEISTAELKVKPRIKLIPLRTFPEAAPVESEFLIRFQQNGAQAPSIALFDVSGKKWEAELMQSIKTWLAEKVDKALPIIA